ncbi:MAG: lipid II flippase MurJ, partial [Thermoanaerobaculia bacterium]
AIGNVIVAALYQGGRFGSGDTLLVWYILIGSTVGLLAMTLGRLYSSAFYALRDTKTPLRFAMIRVTLTAGLGWIFAIPMRPMLIRGMQAAHVPLPVIGNGYVALGAIALTATAGIAGWLEFLLLRHSLAKRIGAARIEAAYLLKLWGASVLAGVIGALCNLYLIPYIPLPRFFSHITIGILICGAFGVVYFAATIALAVPEARATLQRFKRR